MLHSEEGKGDRGIIDEYYLEDIDEEELEDYLYKGLVAGLGDPIPDITPQRSTPSRMRAQTVSTWVWAWCCSRMRERES